MGNCEEIKQTISIKNTDDLDATYDQDNEFDNFFKNSPVTMVALNSDKKVVAINKAAKEALGILRDNSLGKCVGELFNCKNAKQLDDCGNTTECCNCIVKNCIAHTFWTGETCHNIEGESIPTGDKDIGDQFYRISTALINKNKKSYILLTFDDITKSKIIERSLKESEERYKDLTDLLPQTVFETDVNGTLTFANSQAYSMFGHTEDEFGAGLNILQFIIPEDRDKTKLNMKKLMDGEEISGVERTALRKDGSTFSALIYVNAIIKNGIFSGFRGILIDITDRKRSEQQLLETTSRNQAILDILPDLLFICHVDGTIYSYNAPPEAELYISCENIVGKKISDVLPKNIATKIIPLITEAVKTNETQTFQYQLPVNEIIRDFEARLVSNEKDNVLIVIEDITNKKNAERKLEESEEKYSALVENSNDGIIIIQDFVLKYVNKKMLEITGYLQEEVENFPFTDFVSPDYLELVKERYIKRMKGELLQPNYEIEVLSKDKTLIPIEVNASQIIYKDKPADMAILRDVTENKKATTALLESEEKYRKLTENAAKLIYRADPVTFIASHVNRSIERIYGYTVEEWINDPSLLNTTFYPEDIEKIHSRVDELKANQENGILEYRIIRKDGATRWVENHIAWELDDEGNAIVINGIIYDITERKEAEIAILNAKLAAEAANKAKSEFIANMSHELRTPLNSIIGFSDVIYGESHGKLNQKQKRYTLNVLNNGKHLLDIINGILDLSKLEAKTMKINYEDVLISDVINEIEHTLLPDYSKKNIDLSINFDVKDISIKVDKTKFRQIIYNLLGNAIKFTKDGGKVTLNIQEKGNKLYVEVKDTGIGIKEDDLDRIFEPFSQVDSSTTREHGGNGLGLHLAQKFIEMHGGNIWINSELNKGSSFEFTIPLLR